MWDWLKRYASNDDPLAAAANTIALVVVSNQPFYPLYVWWLVSDTIWPTLLTFLSTPLFALVPAASRRHPLAGKALLVVAGIANTILSTWAFGKASAVEIFLLPCALIAALLFRPSERAVGFALIGAAGLAWFWLGGLYPPALHAYSAEEYGRFASLNIGSASTLTIFVGLLGAGLIARRDAA